MKEEQKSFSFSARLKGAARLALGLLFIVGSAFHFTAIDFELQLVPSFLPWRRAAIVLTGVLELLGGIGILIPRFQQASGRGLALLLVAMFPANIYHTVKRKQFQGFTSTPLYHILRWPLQGVLIWWALWCSEKEE